MANKRRNLSILSPFILIAVLFSYILYLDRLSYSPILVDVYTSNVPAEVVRGTSLAYDITFTKARPCTVRQITDHFWHLDNGDNKVFTLSIGADSSGKERVLRNIPPEDYPQTLNRKISVPKTWNTGRWRHLATLEYVNCKDMPFADLINVDLPKVEVEVIDG